jgi:hypothetical protein
MIRPIPANAWSDQYINFGTTDITAFTSKLRRYKLCLSVLSVSKTM